ncbi:aldehyde reductase [Colletotrichum salicis]|uniref:Aldehyde reductase n=1 Tax=Colletotrichum salicis TaxID=1209931 RepID=A0A135V7X6_9PEZI|nr:aldehyde reductase [Colletotrichum salicis]
MNANLIRSRLLLALQAALPKQQLRNVSTRSVQWELNTGAKIPAIGFGTFQDADAQEEAVKTALKVGFRHIDTARVYDTEIQVGKGIKASGVPRENIFLGTKLWCNSHHPDDVEAALDAFLKDLDTPYVDLFLMHYPCTFQRGEDRFPKGKDGKMIMGKKTFVDTWKAMEALLKTGKAKAIGVSNYSKDEVQTLIDKGSVVPAVHQMELHPYLQQQSFVDWQRANGTHMTHFSPLGNQNSFYREVSWSKEASHMARVIDHPTLAEIAEKHDKTPVQVALAWGVNSGRSVIPKSVIEWQIKENLESDFLLDGEDMEKIAKMDLKARFNVPSEEYRWQLYKGLDGVRY